MEKGIPILCVLLLPKNLYLVIKPSNMTHIHKPIFRDDSLHALRKPVSAILKQLSVRKLDILLEHGCWLPQNLGHFLHGNIVIINTKRVIKAVLLPTCNLKMFIFLDLHQLVM